jgi:glycosyltransferase involved in cell wall biosynthesis
MKIGLISPMPPDRSGVADYAAGLAEGLRRYAEIRLVNRPGPAYDNFLYQVGNNPLHLAAYRGALARPGITVLHDAVLHHLLLGALDEQAYVAEFTYNYGEWMRGLALELWRSRSRSASDARYFSFPMLRRIVERSRAVVVHNPGAGRMVKEAVPEARLALIPHYFVPPRPPGGTGDLRDRLGIARGEIVVGVFGYLRPSKRIGSVLQAMPALRRARLLLVGEFVSPELEASLAPQLAAVRAVRLGHVPEAEFWRLAAMTDICVNLRYPTAGETSGIAIKMMGIGKPVLVTAAEETASYPELSVIRIDPGEPEVEMLAHYLRALSESEDMRREIGRRAAAHIAEHHTLDKVVRMYLDLVRTAG